MNDSCGSFEENFRQCCLQSCSRLAFRQSQIDPAYAAAEANCDRLYDALRAQLPREAHPLLENLDDAKNQVLSMEYEFLYQQGFQDCVTLLRWVGLF